MEPECCPPFEPDRWNEKSFTWKDKKFVKEKVFCFFHIPIGFGATMKRFMEKLEQAQAKCLDGLGLSDHTSRWNMDIYISVDKDIPNTEMHKINGDFISKVYEGPFSDTGKWCNDFYDYAKGKGVEVLKLYMWYTTCPKCAKKIGKNYVVILGQVKNQ